MNYKTACPHCNGHIAFESVHAGRTTPCPHCANPIILTVPEPHPAETREAPPSWNLLARVFYNMEQKQLEQTREGGQRQERIAATMDQVRSGTWQVEVKNIVLSTGEKALWRQTAALVDPSKVGQAERGGAYGVTTKILKSITTRLTQPPSKLAAAATASQTVDIHGEFIITNNRLVFTSKPKTFIVRFENVIDVVSTLEGIKFSETGKSLVYAIRYDQPNGDIISELVQFGLDSARENR